MKSSVRAGCKWTRGRIARVCGSMFLAAGLIAALCGWSREASKYADRENWAVLDTESDRAVDVFFLAPTIETGLSGNRNMRVDDSRAREKFVEAVNMERGIYEGAARMIAPYYGQAAFTAYLMSEEKAGLAFTAAYADVRDAFLYYMEEYNGGRPFLLAGYSQGADMALRLQKEFFRDETYGSLLVAAYCPGWPVTQEDLDEAPWLHMARGKSDTGVIISFNSEAVEVKSSLLVPAGMKSLSINPLNWRTDGTPADRSENLGACFVDGSGGIVSEQANLTGAYLDPVRGTLKILDVRPEDYPGFPLPDGVYHSYECQFFYRNLQKNVEDRVDAYLGQGGGLSHEIDR